MAIQKAKFSIGDIVKHKHFEFRGVIYDVDFELKNDFLNILMTKSFQFGLDKIADAFQKRAEDLFSKR